MRIAELLHRQSWRIVSRPRRGHPIFQRLHQREAREFLRGISFGRYQPTMGAASILLWAVVERPMRRGDGLRTLLAVLDALNHDRASGGEGR